MKMEQWDETNYMKTPHKQQLNFKTRTKKKPPENRLTDIKS